MKAFFIEQIMTNNLDHLKSEVIKIENQIGNTPLADLSQLSPNPDVRIFAKQEWRQLGGSVKARPAFNIIKQAVFTGQYLPGQRLIDASSGNTGIAYAVIGEALNIPITICLPQNASKERIELLEQHHAEIIFTSPFGSTDEAQEKAKEMVMEYPQRYFYADQYANDNNWRAHYQTTADEIFKQSNGEVSHFVAGLGTTGTFVGTGRRLLELNHKIRLISLQPDIALHGLEGWKHLGTARVPSIYDDTVAHSSMQVSTESAYDLIKQVDAEYGYKISPSAAANLAGTLAVADKIKSGTIVTVFADNADKYQEVINQIFKNEQYEVAN